MKKGKEWKKGEKGNRYLEIGKREIGNRYKKDRGIGKGYGWKRKNGYKPK